jgi:hypothetical protein
VKLRAAATALALGALGCFVLPWFSVQHQGRTLIHFTGLELLMGTTFHRTFEYGGQLVSPGTVPSWPLGWFGPLAIAVAVAGGWAKQLWMVFLGRYSAMAAFGVIAVLGSRYREIESVFPGTEIMRMPAWWVALVATGSLAILLSRGTRNRLAGRSLEQPFPRP